MKNKHQETFRTIIKNINKAICLTTGELTAERVIRSRKTGEVFVVRQVIGVPRNRCTIS